MTDKLQNQIGGERGIALITSLMMTTMLLALGLAVAFSATTDTVTSKSQRVGEMSFYAADTGLSIARRALLTALTEEVDDIRKGKAKYGQDGSGYYYIGATPSGGGFPDVQIIPDPDAAGAQDYQFYKNIYAKANKLIADAVKDSTFDTYRKINGSNFIANIRPLSGSVDPINPAATNPIQAIKFRYSIQATGTTDAGGSSTVDETGRISIDVTLASSSAPGQGRDFSFSGFGAFFDEGDTTANSALASGTFSGPVHTNTHFAFFSNRNVAFRDAVSQVDSYIRYDSTDFSRGQISIPKQDISGIDLSSKGYNKVNRVPLPANNFSQEYAVINGTGILDMKDGMPVDPPAVLPKDPLGNLLPIFDTSGRVTAAALGVNLRDSANNAPPVLLGKLNGGLDGVYVPSGDGINVTGAGVYVQGNVTDMQLYVNGTDQIYSIKQSSGKVTTVTISYANNKTTISDSAGKTTTFKGIPTDKSDPQKPVPGVSLFVKGNINSLRGGFDATTGRDVAAIAPKTAMTITAQGDITITGDIKYANAVLDSQGLPVQNVNSVQNVLGIFTNNGNVNLAPNANYNSSKGLSLEINAAIAAFNADKSDDAGGIDGSIVYTGSTAPTSNDKWTLIGSRVQAKINNIGYVNRNIYFDVRFSGGTFRPPYFPGTDYELDTPSGPAIITIASVNDAKPVGVSWYRENN